MNIYSLTRAKHKGFKMQVLRSPRPHNRAWALEDREGRGGRASPDGPPELGDNGGAAVRVCVRPRNLFWGRF